MICHMTFGVRSTYPWAWIAAFIVNARLGLRAVIVIHTFGATFRIRIAVIFGQTTARAGIIPFFANGIRTAW